MANIRQRFQKDGTYGPSKRVHLERTINEWLVPLNLMYLYSGNSDFEVKHSAVMKSHSTFQPQRGLILHKCTSEDLMEELGIDLTVRALVRGLDRHVLVDEYLCEHLLKIHEYGLACKRGLIVGLVSYHEVWAVVPLAKVLEASDYVELSAL